VSIADFGLDFGERPDPASLGPVQWQPQPAPALALPRADGGTFDLAANRGRPTLVVFYLGFGCLHCVEQLRALGPKAAAFAELGIDVVAVGSDPADKAAASLAAMSAEERFPFPLLADPALAAFRAWRCHDDFESMPLHGTFLVDAAGRVRWQDISFEPFTELAWLVGESRRLLALPAAAAGAGAGN
jgi:peroxiredoxin